MLVLIHWRGYLLCICKLILVAPPHSILLQHLFLFFLLKEQVLDLFILRSVGGSELVVLGGAFAGARALLFLSLLGLASLELGPSVLVVGAGCAVPLVGRGALTL